jgi:1,4-alpha-glucan branching enzyme
MSKRATAVAEKKPRTKPHTFTLSAPEAKGVVVTGSFCDWQTDLHELKKNKAGLWETTLPLVPGRHEYRFLVDGVWRNDPTCTECVANPFGSDNCVLNV